MISQAHIFFLFLIHFQSLELDRFQAPHRPIDKRVVAFRKVLCQRLRFICNKTLKENPQIFKELDALERQSNMVLDDGQDEISRLWVIWIALRLDFGGFSEFKQHLPKKILNRNLVPGIVYFSMVTATYIWQALRYPPTPLPL